MRGTTEHTVRCRRGLGVDSLLSWPLYIYDLRVTLKKYLKCHFKFVCNCTCTHVVFYMQLGSLLSDFDPNKTLVVGNGCS